MIDVIKEYLASIGFDVDQKGFNEANKSFSKLEQTISHFQKVLGENEAFKKFSEAIDKALKGLMEIIASFATSTLGAITIIGAAIIAVSGIVTAFTYKFMSDIGKADMKIQMFALDLMTTVKNARSLKTVMDTMGLNSIEDLKYVNLNPELRKQFLSLRQAASGLEPNADMQEGLKNIRAVGFEFQKLNLLMSYFWIHLGGSLGKLLAGPLKHLQQFIESLNKALIGNMDRWSNDIARLLDIFVELFDITVKLFEVLFKIDMFLSHIRKLPQSIRLLSDILLFFLKQMNYLIDLATGKAHGRKLSSLSEHAKNTTLEFAGLPGMAKNHGNVNIAGNVTLSPQSRNFIDRLQDALSGRWTVTSGMENGGAGHAMGENSHAAGRKFDLGLNGKSNSQIIDLLKSMVSTPGFEYAGIELNHTRYAQIIEGLKRQKVDTSKIGDFSGAHHTGPNLDVRTSPVTVTINVNGAKDPKATAQEVHHKLRTALGTRNLQGSFA